MIKNGLANAAFVYAAPVAWQASITHLGQSLSLRPVISEVVFFKNSDSAIFTVVFHERFDR